MLKTLIFCCAILGGLVSSQAQITTYFAANAYGKLDFSNARIDNVSRSYTNSKVFLEPGLAFGMRWEKSGLGLQIAARSAKHNARFKLKKDHNYANPKLAEAIDFGLGGTFVPLSLTWQKAFGEKKSWGIQAQLGIGMLFIDRYDALNEDRLEGEFMSMVTGEEEPFEWMTVVAGLRSDNALMFESGLGVFANLTKHISISMQALSTQSFAPLAFQRVWFYDNVVFPNELNINTSGESLGLQLSLKYSL